MTTYDYGVFVMVPCGLAQWILVVMMSQSSLTSHLVQHLYQKEIKQNENCKFTSRTYFKLHFVLVVLEAAVIWTGHIFFMECF